MRVTVLQPDPNAPLDRFAAWLDAAGAAWSVVRLWEEAVPELPAVGNALVLLGGHGDACDAGFYPWLPAVRALLRDAVAAGLPTLGICLGHQILADALGGRVAVADERGGEVGPVLIRWSDSAAADPVLGPLVELGAEVPMPQSHRDAVVGLPPGAVELAASELYANQAFRVGSALGVQFHPEASPHLMAAWAHLDGLEPGPMLAVMTRVDGRVAEAGEAIARGFVAQVAARG